MLQPNRTGVKDGLLTRLEMFNPGFANVCCGEEVGRRRRTFSDILITGTNLGQGGERKGSGMTNDSDSSGNQPPLPPQCLFLV